MDGQLRIVSRTQRDEGIGLIRKLWYTEPLDGRGLDEEATDLVRQYRGLEVSDIHRPVSYLWKIDRENSEPVMIVQSSILSYNAS